MTAKFDYVVCSNEESHDIDKLFVDEVQRSLLVREKIINSHISTTKGRALKASNNGPVAAEGVGRGTCNIKDLKGGMITCVHMTGNKMFPIIIVDNGVDFQTCFIAKMKYIDWLWKLRYIHLNFNELKTLLQKGMVIMLP